MNERPESQQLEWRVARLEASNKRLRMFLIVFGCAVVAMGATRMEDQRRVAAEVVQATEFRLVDSQGNMRGTFTTMQGYPQLSVLSSSGAVASLTPHQISLSRAGDVIGTGTFTLQFAEDSTAAGLRIAGEHGEMRFVALKDGPAFEIRDSTGNPRVVVGTTRLSRTTGSTEITTPASILLLDQQGHVVWRAPAER